MAARITLSTTSTAPAEFARELRSLAAKIDLDSLAPGADIKIGNTRVQVATPQVSDIRQFAIDNGYQVGGRGRYSKELLEAFAAHQKAERKAKREAAAARKAEREAAAVAV